VTEEIQSAAFPLNKSLKNATFSASLIFLYAVYCWKYPSHSVGFSFVRPWNTFGVKESEIPSVTVCWFSGGGGGGLAFMVVVVVVGVAEVVGVLTEVDGVPTDCLVFPLSDRTLLFRGTHRQVRSANGPCCRRRRCPPWRRYCTVFIHPPTVAERSNTQLLRGWRCRRHHPTRTKAVRVLSLSARPGSVERFSATLGSRRRHLSRRRGLNSLLQSVPPTC
jgi:hypothetical protein